LSLQIGSDLFIALEELHGYPAVLGPVRSVLQETKFQPPAKLEELVLIEGVEPLQIAHVVARRLRN
jgi:hypothetical protein